MDIPVPGDMDRPQEAPPEDIHHGENAGDTPALQTSDSIGDEAVTPEMVPTNDTNGMGEHTPAETILDSSSDEWKSAQEAPAEDQPGQKAEAVSDPLFDESATEVPAEDSSTTDRPSSTTMANTGMPENLEGPITTEVPVVSTLSDHVTDTPGFSSETAPAEDISNEPTTPDTPKEYQIHASIQAGEQGDALITDKDEAVEAAYAAKPFEDAKIEKADVLSQDQQETLSWLSSEAAESAVKSYRESKTQMTEAEMVIKEHFEPIRHIANSETSNWERDKANFYGRELSDEERDKKYALTETLLQEVVDDQFESIMQDGGSTDRDKLDGVQQLAKIRETLKFELGLGLGDKSPFSDSPTELVQRYKDQPEMLVSILWGKFIAGAVQDRGFFSIDALEQISKLTGQPFETLFDKVHDTFVEADSGSKYKSNTDQALDRQGYLWSPSRNRYVKISE